MPYGSSRIRVRPVGTRRSDTERERPSCDQARRNANQQERGAFKVKVTEVLIRQQLGEAAHRVGDSGRTHLVSRIITIAEGCVC